MYAHVCVYYGCSVVCVCACVTKLLRRLCGLVCLRVCALCVCVYDRQIVVCFVVSCVACLL